MISLDRMGKIRGSICVLCQVRVGQTALERKEQNNALFQGARLERLIISASGAIGPLAFSTCLLCLRPRFSLIVFVCAPNTHTHRVKWPGGYKVLFWGQWLLSSFLLRLPSKFALGENEPRLRAHIYASAPACSSYPGSQWMVVK